jgi:hypothetical protein
MRTGTSYKKLGRLNNTLERYIERWTENPFWVLASVRGAEDCRPPPPALA